MKTFLTAVASFCLLSSVAGAAVGPEISFEKSDNGRLKRASYRQAEQLCANQGAHLATAHDWALWATDHGAAGVRETAYPGVWNANTEVDAEWARNRAEGFIAQLNGGAFDCNGHSSNSIDFYFNPQGYSYPHLGVAAETLFWTSSPGDSGWFEVFLLRNAEFSLSRFNGKVCGPQPDLEKHSVGCVSNGL